MNSSDLNISELVKSLFRGQNYFISGPAGVGKSYVVNKIKEYCREMNIKVATTSSTGISALQIGGVTIHKLLGLGIQKDLSSIDRAKKTDYFKHLKREMLKVDVLVVDESSMIRSDLCDLINGTLKVMLGNNLPFGGMRMIFVGDFLQIPPVVRRDEDLKEPWAYQSTSWKSGNIKTIILDKVYRQDNMDFIEALHSLRVGEYNEKVKELIKKCSNNKKIENVPHFVSRNAQAESINKRELDKIESPVSRSRAICKGTNPKDVEQLKKDLTAKEYLELKVGAQVIFLCNDKEEQFRNGSLGKVVSITNGYPKVKITETGETIEVGYHSWEKKNANGRVLATFTQIPLKLAYAITIHKSQGMTLDGASVDCDGIFSEGALYVSLSRVKNPDNLSIRGFKEKHIMASESSINFYKKAA